jgi:hypothetical protein
MLSPYTFCGEYDNKNNINETKQTAITTPAIAPSQLFLGDILDIL